ncbi:hypothetical protein D3C73_1597110 [compost metagenome]
MAPSSSRVTDMLVRTWRMYATRVMRGGRRTDLPISASNSLPALDLNIVSTVSAFM